ncbi:hypothetical protein GCM10018952_15340 [Streptosporangium vulgare]
MASVIERADQLVLDYVSRAADAAHGVLPPRQRIDFVAVLRRRIDAERAGMDDPAAVARVLARFGDPAALVHREVRRLGRETPSRSSDRSSERSSENSPGRPGPRVSEEGSRGSRGARGSRGSRSSGVSREGSGTVPRPREDPAGGSVRASGDLGRPGDTDRPGGADRLGGAGRPGDVGRHGDIGRPGGVDRPGDADRSTRATDLDGTSAVRPVAAMPLAAPTPDGSAPEDREPPREGHAPEGREPTSREPVPGDHDPASSGPVPEGPVPTPGGAVSGPDGPGRAADGPPSPSTPPSTPSPSFTPSSSSTPGETAGRSPSTAREVTPGDSGLPPSRRSVRGHPYASTGARPDTGEPARGRPTPDLSESERPEPGHPEQDRLEPERPEPDVPGASASRGSSWTERIFPARSRSSSADPGEDEPDVAAGSRPGSGEDAADDWEDAVESDPPTEEIPPVQDPLPPPVARRETPEQPREPRQPQGPEGPEEPREPEDKREEEPRGDRPEAPRGKQTDAEGRPGLPPGVARGMREAEERLARRRARNRPDWLRRSRPARSREDVVPGTQDARTILLGHRREMVGLGLLALAGLLIPFPFAPIAIFRIPVLVWAVAALVVIACENWHTSDKALGLAAPIVSYSLGGGLVALVRARNDLGTVVDEFFAISGLMFMLGTAWAVFWMAYRLLNPPIPVGRGIRRPG